MNRTKVKKKNRRKVTKNNRRKQSVKRVIGYLLIFTIAGLYYPVKGLNNAVKKGFKLLPKTIQTLIIYTLIILSAFGIYNAIKPKEVQIEREIQIETIYVQQENIVDTTQETTESQAETTQSKLIFDRKEEQDIFDKSIELGMTQEQAIITISISRHETGNWSSEAFLESYNFGGIMTNNTKNIKSYDSYEEGLIDFVTLLKDYYFDEGRTSIEDIGAKYCPIGATNDPTDLNKYWVGGVTYFFNEYSQQTVE